MPAPGPAAPYGGPGGPAYGAPADGPAFGQPAGSYPGSDPFGAPAAYPGGSDGAPGPVTFLGAFTKNISATILLVVSIVSTILFLVIGPPTAIMSLVALKRTTDDPAKGVDFAKTSWLVFALNAVVGGIGIAAFYWFRNRT